MNSPSLPATASSTIMNHPNPQSLQHSKSRRGKPSHVQTSFLPPISSTPSVPASAISASSIATSSSVQASPIMSPETTQIITNNSSISGSPEGPRGRESEFPTPQFDLLPESIVSRKSSQSAMSEAVQISKSPGLIRRLSNRASQFAGRRRQSSTTAMSRDNSSGPVIMRRRSDSTNTAPDGAREAAAFFYDSDEDDDLLRKEPGSYLGLGIDAALRDYPSTTASVSSNGASVGSTAGPVIPATLLQGTTMVKVTKKKKKLLTFVLENEAAKVTWDKNRPAKSFYIDDIKEIRTAKNAENYLREFGVNVHDESRFFSILYAVPDKSKGRAQKVMHLIASDEQTFELWITTLDAISKHREKMMASLSSFNEKAVKAYWRNEMTKQFHDKPHSEEEEDIDIAGLERLCRSLHIHGSSNYFRSKFSQADTQGTGRLNFTEFQEFVKLMKRREDVRALYRDLVSESDKGLTLDQFLGFLRDVQGENVDLDRTHWENIFAKFVRQSKTKEKALQDAADGEIARMNESALTSYLISTFNVPLNNAPPKSLDRPLNEYFITSSHNTYLLGRQVAGESSVEAYISALNKGCRCVEVDCWNGSDGEPVVMHGRTLTSQVSFADVMSTISKYAFSKTPYPLWISLEVHCSPVQQEKMARIIREKCRPYLIEEPIDNSGELPTPQQLLNRILIKVKKPRHFEAVPVMENSSGRSRGSSLSSPYVRPTQLDNSTVSAGLLPPSSYSRTTPGSYARTRIVSRGQFKGSGSEGPDSGLSSSTSDSEGTPEEFPKPNGSTGKTSNIIKVLGELGVYSAGLKFRGFDSPESKAYNHIFSFMENTFDKNSKTQEERRAIARHNMRHMMRVYPNGWRVASTNFDPLRYWRRGVQMVALNWQTYDLGMQMNDAMFAAGPDQSGYVLKPSDMREIKMITTVPEEAGAGHVKRERKNVNFSIEVISAQQLMRPKGLATTRTVDPYIEVEVYHADDKSKESRGVVGDGGLDASGKDGTSGLGSPHRRRTQIVQENGFNPIFDKKFNFELTTKYPDLVFVRWTVRCSQDGFTYNNDRTAPLATYTAKLSSLQQGYRTLPLVDGNGDKFLFSTLFCRIKIEPATSIYINEVSESVGVFKRVFNRTPVSPRIPENNHQ